MWYYLSDEFRTNYHDQLVDQQDEFLALNAHVQVLKVMKHHLDCPKLLQHALHHKELCIQFTCLDLQTILASMKMHSCHTSIQFLGLYTIAQLPLSLQSKIQVTFDTSLDGISFILQVMRTLSNHSCIVEASCDWIYRLSCVKYVRKLLLASHVRTRASIMATAVETNSHNRPAQMAALDALNFLTTRLQETGTSENVLMDA